MLHFVIKTKKVFFSKVTVNFNLIKDSALINLKPTHCVDASSFIEMIVFTII